METPETTLPPGSEKIETLPAKSLGINVSRVEFAGPKIIPEKGESHETHFSGFKIESPEKTSAVIRGGLTGETYVVSYDHRTGEQTCTILPPDCLDNFASASEKMTPDQLEELVSVTHYLAQADRVLHQAAVIKAGGREKRLLAESQKLVEAGEFQDIETARQAIINRTEIHPRSKRAQEAISRAAETGEVPTDVDSSW